jgi:hypothetical protein
MQRGIWTVSIPFFPYPVFSPFQAEGLGYRHISSFRRLLKWVRFDKKAKGKGWDADRRHSDLSEAGMLRLP